MKYVFELNLNLSFINTTYISEATWGSLNLIKRSEGIAATRLVPYFFIEVDVQRSGGVKSLEFKYFSMNHVFKNYIINTIANIDVCSRKYHLRNWRMKVWTFLEQRYRIRRNKLSIHFSIN